MMRVYLDSNATTPLDPRVLEAMLPFLAEHHGNPSSVHAFGRIAREAVDDARARVATAIGARAPAEVVFTSGGAEANSLAVCGAVAALRQQEPGRLLHVIVSSIEHSSVLQAAAALEAQGVAVTRVAPGRDGVVPAAAVIAAIRDGATALVSLMAVNNETGVVQPVPAVAAACRQRGILLHSDAVQALGKTLDWRPDRAAAPGLLSFSAHKLYGPKGAGVLYVRSGTPLARIVHGGEQEGGRRGGTENTPAIMGLSAAFELALAEQGERCERLAAAQERIEAILRAAEPRCVVNGVAAARAPGTTSVTFPAEYAAETLLASLDLEGVAVSAGSACAAGTVEPSHVLQAMGLDAAAASRSLRISALASTTAEEIDHFAVALESVCVRMRSARRGGSIPG